MCAALAPCRDRNTPRNRERSLRFSLGMKYWRGQRESAKRGVAFGTFGQVRDECLATLRAKLPPPERSEILSCFETIHFVTRARPALIICSACLRRT